MHANAALTPKARLKIGQLIVDHGWPVARAAERFQTSATTAGRSAALNGGASRRPASACASSWCLKRSRWSQDIESSSAAPGGAISLPRSVPVGKSVSSMPQI